MRLTVAAVFLLLLAACSKAGDGNAVPGKQADRLPCALAGAAEFAPVCTLEQTRSEGAEIWIVRYPEGGFRRFQVIDGGTRIATADGRDEVEAHRVGSELEVKVGDDRYRFPAAPEAGASTDAPKP